MASTDLPTQELEPSTARPRLRSIDGRLQIALAMVLIALLGAITAYRGALAEMENALLERKLDQGRLLELYFRQDQTDGDLIFEVLNNRRASSEELARALMQRADAARFHDIQERATALDIQAQEELAAGRALRSVYWVLPTLSGAEGVEQPLRRRAVQRLNVLGFEATWAAPSKSGEHGDDAEHGEDASAVHAEELGGVAHDTIWHDLELEIEHGHQRVPALAFAVVGFVAALVLLTIADIARRPARKRGLFYLGVALTLLPVVYAIQKDPDIWPWFVGTAVIFIALAVAGWWVGALQDPEDGGHPFHPAELELRAYSGGHLTRHAVHDRFTQLAVLIIAVTVLLSAVVGAWFSIADTRARQEALDAVGFETDMLKRGSLYGAIRSVVLGDLAGALEERARVAVGTVRDRLLAGNALTLATEVGEARFRSREYGEQVQARIASPEYGLQADPHFPRKLLTWLALAVDPNEPENGLYRNAWESFGNWEAARTESLEAHERAVILLATLTVFAVAIYLTGQALGMGRGRPAFVLTGLAVAFVLVGLGVALQAETSARHKGGTHENTGNCNLDPATWGPAKGGPNAMAARQFAIGVVMQDNAASSDQFQEAIDHLRCAVALRPDFAEASRLLADTSHVVRSSQMNETFVSLPGIHELDGLVEDEQQAIEALERKSLSPSQVRGSFAFNGALMTLSKDRNASLDASVIAARGALEELPESNEALRDSRRIRLFNLAVILLANRNREEALETYRAALASKEPFSNKFLFSTINDLNLFFELRCPHPKSTEEGDKSAEPRAEPTEECKGLKRDVENLTGDIVLAIKASDSDWTAALAPDSLAAEADAASLTVQMKWSPEGKSGRIVLLWSKLDPEWNVWHVIPSVSGPVSNDDAQDTDAGGWSVRRSSLSIEAACTEAGRYRVEAYSDGARVGGAEITVDHPAATAPIRFRDLNLAVCAPDTWQRWLSLPESSGAPARPADRQLMDGLFTGGEKPRAALLLRALPGPRVGRDVADDLNATLDEFNNRPSVKVVSNQQECLAAGRAQSPIARVWRDSEGTAYVAIGAFVNEAGWPSKVCEALMSVELYYAPLEPEPKPE